MKSAERRNVMMKVNEIFTDKSYILKSYSWNPLTDGIISTVPASTPNTPYRPSHTGRPPDTTQWAETPRTEINFSEKTTKVYAKFGNDGTTFRML